ncbi:MAG TPA: hypothetical protein PLV27_05435 [Anaerolineaceae bacterium]|nr:hypothetical protein [Anaerolineaceae bacterium]
MTKSIYIHIGPHKTGTSTIQYSLSQNRQQLQDRGILYPISGTLPGKPTGQHNLAWELTADERFTKRFGTWKNVIREIHNSKAEQIILSSEDFCHCNQEQIEKIRALLEEYEVKVIVYLRRQDLKLQSQWAVRQVRIEYLDQYDPFPVWLEKNPKEFIVSDYARLIAPWAEVFGRDGIHARVLEKDQLSGTLLQDFLSACQITNPEQIRESENRNISPGIKKVILFQELKKRFTENSNPARIKKVLEIIAEYAEQAGWNQQKWSVIDRDLYDRISQYYEESNRRIAKEFFSREELFFEPYDDRYQTHFSIKDFPPGELLDVMVYVSSQLLTGQGHSIKVNP